MQHRVEDPRHKVDSYWITVLTVFISSIGQDQQLTYSEESQCKTQTASVCSESTLYSVTVTGGATKTTGTSVASDCQTVRGCSASNQDSSQTSTVTASCTPAAQRRMAVIVMDALDKRHMRRNATDRDDGLSKMDNRCGRNAVVYPRNPKNVGSIPHLLRDYKGQYQQVQAQSLGFTAFFWVPLLDDATFRQLLFAVCSLFILFPFPHLFCNDPVWSHNSDTFYI